MRQAVDYRMPISDTNGVRIMRPSIFVLIACTVTSGYFCERANADEIGRLPFRNDATMSSCLFEDDLHIATVHSDGCFRVWRLTDGTMTREWKITDKPLRALCRIPRSSFYACLSKNRKILILDTIRRHLVAEIDGDALMSSLSVAASSGDTLIAGRDCFRMLRWNEPSHIEQRLDRIEQAASLTSISISSNGKQVAFAFSGIVTNKEPGVVVWSSFKKESYLGIRVTSKAVDAVSFSEESDEQLFYSHSGQVICFDLQNKKNLSASPAWNSRIESLNPIDSRSLVICGSCDGHHKVWDYAKNSVARTIQGDAGDIVSSSISPDQLRFAILTRGQDCTLRVWNTFTGYELRGASH
jgi:WD40 repeat protein